MVLDIKHLIALIFVGILGANSASAEPVAPLLDEYLNRYRSTPQEQRSFEPKVLASRSELRRILFEPSMRLTPGFTAVLLEINERAQKAAGKDEIASSAWVELGLDLQLEWESRFEEGFLVQLQRKTQVVQSSQWGSTAIAAAVMIPLMARNPVQAPKYFRFLRLLKQRQWIAVMGAASAAVIYASHPTGEQISKLIHSYAEMKVPVPPALVLDFASSSNTRAQTEISDEELTRDLVSLASGAGADALITLVLVMRVGQSVLTASMVGVIAGIALELAVRAGLYEWKTHRLNSAVTRSISDLENAVQSRDSMKMAKAADQLLYHSDRLRAFYSIDSNSVIREYLEARQALKDRCHSESACSHPMRSLELTYRGRLAQELLKRPNALPIRNEQWLTRARLRSLIRGEGGQDAVEAFELTTDSKLISEDGILAQNADRRQYAKLLVADFFGQHSEWKGLAAGAQERQKKSVTHEFARYLTSVDVAQDQQMVSALKGSLRPENPTVLAMQVCALLRQYGHPVVRLFETRAEHQLSQELQWQQWALTDVRGGRS